MLAFRVQTLNLLLKAPSVSLSSHHSSYLLGTTDYNHLICIFLSGVVNEDLEFIDELLSANSQIFWFGDLNYRINMSDGEVRKRVALKKWDELMNYDQVRIMKFGLNYWSPIRCSNFNQGLILEFSKGLQVLSRNLDSDVNPHSHKDLPM